MSWARPQAVADQTVELSKALSWLLRHNAVQEKMVVHPGGFVNIKDVLNHRRFSKFTLQDIEKVVSGNDKQRFAIRNDPATNELQIRANQGHSFPIEEHGLTPITDPSEFPVVIHGTYFRVWDSIRKKGLSRMRRNQIHFAIGEPGDKAVISGMRNSAEIYIYVDLSKALADGIEFFRSENNVVLCPGNSQGYLETKYFLKVVNSKTGAPIPL